MPDNKKDWFKIYRSLLAEDLWLAEPFTKGQAWIDLIGRANYAPTEKISGAHCTIIERGQLVTSIQALANRWQWSPKKVRAYLSALSEAQMVSIKGTTKGTTLTIEKYAFYQSQGQTKDTTKGERRASEGQTKDTLNKNIRRKEVKNTPKPPQGDAGGDDNSDLVDILRRIGRGEEVD